MNLYGYSHFIHNFIIRKKYGLNYSRYFGNYIQSYSITLIKRCKDLLLSNLFITFAL